MSWIRRSRQPGGRRDAWGKAGGLQAFRLHRVFGLPADRDGGPGVEVVEGASGIEAVAKDCGVGRVWSVEASCQAIDFVRLKSDW